MLIFNFTRTLKFHENFKNTRVIISGKSLYPLLRTQWSAGGLFQITSHVLGNLNLHFSPSQGSILTTRWGSNECTCSIISMSCKINCFPKKSEKALLHLYRYTRGAAYSGDDARSTQTDKDLSFSSLDRSSWALKYRPLRWLVWLLR